MTGFDVDVDALRQHACHVGAVGELVGGVVSAASTVAAHDAAFGTLIGPVIVPGVNHVEAGATGAVREAAATVQATARSVGDMSDVYEHVDTHVSHVMTRAAVTAPEAGPGE